MDQRTIEWIEFNQTVVSPTALGATLLCGVAMLVVARRRALLPLLLVSCFIPVAQRLVVGGLDFNMIRVVILFGLARLLLRGEHAGLRFGPLDAVFAAWLVASSLVHVAREASVGSLIWRAGYIFEAAGTYYLFRCLLRRPDDLLDTLRYFAWIAVPFALVMSLEYATGRNVFSVFGGVPEFTEVREGTLRCQGAFGHPILAGDFGAGLAPLFVGALLSRRVSRPLAAAAAVAATAIVVYSGSSGPLLATLAALAGWGLWFLRWHMNLVRWALVGAAGMLQLVMNHPIWFVFAVVGVIGGSTGWHRYLLIDSFIRNVGEWMLLGTRSTAHWGWGMQDITNHFVLEGVRGGLLGFSLFVAVFVLAFRGVGLQLRSLARRAELSPAERRSWQLVLWSLGVSLFAHAMAMTAVTYTDQMAILFYALLAQISSVGPAFAGVRARARRATAAPAAARA